MSVVLRGGLDAAAKFMTQKREAEALARTLGHRLNAFVQTLDSNDFYAYCSSCYDAAYLRVRIFDKPPISGPAVTFRCRRPTPASTGSACRHCGAGLKYGALVLCQAPGRMGPCE